MKYEKFLGANPTQEEIIEKIISGIITPDTKGITLQAMDPSKAYTRKELYDEVLNFCDISAEDFPITRESVWAYCDGDPSKRLRGSLDSIGAVVKLKIKRKGGKYAVAYQKTEAGEDFGDPSVALGTYTINKIYKEGEIPPSLWKIFSTASKREDCKYRRGYSAFRVIKFLYENSGEGLRLEDIINELPELDYRVISEILNSLGKIGIIDYSSPYRDKEGKRQRGWAEYVAKERIDPEEALSEIRKRKKFRIGYLKKVCEYINKHLGEKIERNKISKETGIDKHHVSKCLSALSEIGMLENFFKGREKQSEAKANKYTKLIYLELLAPIEKVAKTLDPFEEEFRSKLDYYSDHKDLWKEDIRTQLYIYEVNKTLVGPRGGKEIRRAIINVLKQAKGNMKVSHITEKVKERISRDVTTKAIHHQLKKLEKIGEIERSKQGYYRLR